jgi:4-amino-4-deoxy-L-arabinose transferase-like glycosyltransferase
VFGTGAALFVLIASIYLLTAAGRFANYDAETMFGVTRSLYTHGSLEVEGCSQTTRSLQCVQGVDGKYYSGYGVVTSIVALPFLAVGMFTGESLGFDPTLVGAAFVAFMNSLVGALACVLFFFWAVRAGCSVRASAVATVLLAFATPLWFHSTKEFYSEPLFTLFLVGSFAALRTGTSRKGAAAAGLLFGLAVGTRVFGLIYLPILAGYAYLVSARSGLLTTRNWRITRTSSFLIGVLACLVVWGALNVVRFGGPLKTGYHTVLPTAGSLFATPPLVGLKQILFNGEVGLAWFSPLVVLLPATWPRFHRQHPIESFACLAIVGFTLLFFAMYSYWHGGWSYGPRLLTPVLPFLILPLLPMLVDGESQRVHPIVTRLAPVMIVIAVGVQVIGIVPPYSRHYYLKPVYEKSSPHPWRSRSTLIDNMVAFPKTVSYVARTPNDPADVTGAERYLLSLPNSVNQFAPDIWWLKAAALGVRWRALLLPVIALSLAAFAAASRIRKATRLTYQ